MFLSSTVIFTYNVSKASLSNALFTFKTAVASFGFPESVEVSIVRQLQKEVHEKIYEYLFDGSEILFEDIYRIQFLTSICILRQVW